MELFRRFTPGMVFPMHAEAGSQIYIDFKREWEKKIAGININFPGKMGEKFTYQK